MSPEAPRSLTQMLREWEDDALVRLLEVRPDLADPPPDTLSALASRATTRTSVRASLDGLSAFDLWVAACLVAADPSERDGEPADAPEASEPLAPATPEMRLAVDRLAARALLWGAADDLRPVRALSGELPTAGWMAADEPPWAQPPELGGRAVDPALVDAAAAGSAFELVRRTGLLVEFLTSTPPSGRRDGELSLVEARRLAEALDLSVPGARMHVELAEAAGLVGRLGGNVSGPLRTTPQVDDWLDLEIPQQWALLARSWWAHHTASGSPQLKVLILDAFGEAGQGVALTAEDLERWVDWRIPRRAVEAGRVIPHLLQTGSLVGVLALGAMSTFARTEHLDALDRLMPERADTVLVQNDLTAVAPGPLTQAAAHELGVLADIESRGSATVYRFTPESIGRAYARGWSRSDIERTLSARSRTAIPQPLQYLVADLDRTRPWQFAGSTRASSSNGGRDVGHRPGVAARRSGPVDKTPDGDALARMVRGMRRAEDSSPDRDAVDGRQSPFGGRHLAGAVGRGGTAERTVETLRQAVETGEPVWIGYVRPAGESSERVVLPQGVDDGRLWGTDASSGDPVTIAVHRISAAHIIRRGPAAAEESRG